MGSRTNGLRSRRILLALIIAFPAQVYGQNPAEPSATNVPKSWTATSSGGSSGDNVNPFRTRTTHSEQNGHIIDRQVIERLGPNGSYELFQEIERESIRFDSATVRTFERTFSRNPDGQRVLTQITEGESHFSSSGAGKSVRTTSNPDGNGVMRVVRREVEETKVLGPDVRERTTTALAPDINGGFQPVLRVEEREKLVNGEVVESRTATQVPDGRGQWQVTEVRERNSTANDKQSVTQEERTLRPDPDGKLAVVDRTVTRSSESAGEKRQTVENYSANLPGTSSDGHLHLNQRTTTVQRANVNGGRTTETQVETRSAGQPGDGLRVSTRSVEVARPGADGQIHQQRTIEMTGSNGSLSTVWVDTGKTDDRSTIQVEIAPKNAPK
jgi:hypothetical protein